MRCSVVLVGLIACAHAPRSPDPANWLELQSEHFVLRTDLPPADAREAIRELERGRAALLIAGWPDAPFTLQRTAVIELADRREMQEFAVEGLEGFFSSDAFDEPLMVFSADHEFGQQDVLKHELAHVLINEALAVKPRWLAEGLACYLDTLRHEPFSGKIRVGEASELRLKYLKARPIMDYAQALHTGREAEALDSETAYGFESASWLLVHWLIDTRPDEFAAFLRRLKTESWEHAFREEFPDLSDAAIREGMRSWWKSGHLRVESAPAPDWNGAIEHHPMDPAEVHAMRADLMRLSPGLARTPGRKALMNVEISQALAGSDPANALSGHPDDWRSWVLLAERAPNDLFAFTRAAELAPHNGSVIALLATAEYNNNGGRQRSLEHALRAAQLAPGRSDVLDILAQLQAFSGNCDEAINLEQRAIDALPDSAAPSVAIVLRKRLSQISMTCAPALSVKTN